MCGDNAKLKILFLVFFLSLESEIIATFIERHIFFVRFYTFYTRLKYYPTKDCFIQRNKVRKKVYIIISTCLYINIDSTSLYLSINIVIANSIIRKYELSRSTAARKQSWEISTIFSNSRRGKTATIIYIMHAILKSLIRHFLSISNVI